MRIIGLVVFVLSVCTVHNVQAQEYDAYERHVYVNKGDSLPYRLLPPIAVEPGKLYPLVLVLHGSGERGNDNEKQLAHGADIFLADSNRSSYPAFVVFPQCSDSSYWSNVIIDRDKSGAERFRFPLNAQPTTAMRLLQQLVSELQKQYPVDTKRLYVGGLSMGGMGTFELVYRMAHTFAAAFPICGAGNPGMASKLTGPSWWIFHGLKDDIVDPGFSRKMEAALKKNRARVKATYFPAANHNSWDPAFAKPDLLSWMFQQKK